MEEIKNLFKQKCVKHNTWEYKLMNKLLGLYISKKQALPTLVSIY